MENKIHQPKVLIAPLDWGLGHTTRCMVLIELLELHGFNIFFAGNEMQQKVISSQFKTSNITFLHLNGYNVSYSKTKWGLPFKLISQLPKIAYSIYSEHQWLKKKAKELKFDLVISDNRFGLFSSLVPSVFITHQLQISAPHAWAIFFIQKVNYYFIQKFALLLVPDVTESFGLAGKLSHPPVLPKIKTIYIGLLNRFELSTLPADTLINNFEIVILLSGPEPQRTILENIFLHQIQDLTHQKVILLRGLPNEKNKLISTSSNLTIYNHLPNNQLLAVLQNSKVIICRSGYTSLMEVLPLQKKLILVPTPGQTEQEYLANHLFESNLAIKVCQKNINLKELLQRVEDFKPIEQKFGTFNKVILIEVLMGLINK